MTTDEITIELKEHAEEAVLLLPAQSDINKEDILQKISAQKICFGLDAAAILAACTACNTDQRIIIAQGQKALDSTPTLLISALDIEGDTFLLGFYMFGSLHSHLLHYVQIRSATLYGSCLATGKCKISTLSLP